MMTSANDFIIVRAYRVSGILVKRKIGSLQNQQCAAVGLEKVIDRLVNKLHESPIIVMFDFS